MFKIEIKNFHNESLKENNKMVCTSSRKRSDMDTYKRFSGEKISDREFEISERMRKVPWTVYLKRLHQIR